MLLREQIEQAMWQGDVETLHRIAPCRCCCSEHTYKDCPARQWMGCKASFSESEVDEPNERPIS